MTRIIKLAKAVFALTCFSLPNALFANSVGQIVDAGENATIERAGQKVYIQRGLTVASGDVITTGTNGQAQLRFQDNTKIVMGANSRLVVESVVFQNPNAASEFTVNAINGAFRFLSGTSKRSTYFVHTPNGIIKTRGAFFDFSAVPQSAVNLVTFKGDVLFCNTANRCAMAGGGCAAVQLNNSGEFTVPKTREAKNALLSRGFPYITNQSKLRKDYRTHTWTCDVQPTQNSLSSQNISGQQINSGQQDGSKSTTPASQPNPDRGGAQTGNNTSAGLGGSSANGTSAGKGGPSGPGNANAGPSGGSSAGGGGASAGGASAGAGGASAGSK